MLGFGILAVVLIVIDHNSGALDRIRSGLTVMVTPIIVVSDYPTRALDVVGEVIITHGTLRTELREANQELLLLKAQTQKMAALISENRRLRDLLGSAAKLAENVLVAEIIAVDPNPDRQIVVLDKGERDGVFLGQPLLDADGLMGQVIEVGPFTCRILLVTDPSHSVPVQVNRNNLRMIAVGTGSTKELNLIYVPDTADVAEGDLLISSGLGGRFPVGYPVGSVTEVVHDPGEPFALVRAVPTARLDRSRHVLLVFTEEDTTAEPITGELANGR